MTSRQYIRQYIRDLRNALSETEQTQAAYEIVQQCASNLAIQKAKSIAVYLSNDGEIDTAPLIKWLWQQNKKLSLPVLHPFSKGQLLFLEYSPSTSLVYNKYQILEPKLDKTKIILLSEIDLILTPLVAFDDAGNRLGMGGGYYDRTLSNWAINNKNSMPIGLAHSCQHVQQLDAESWDIPLPQIITPKKTWSW